MAVVTAHSRALHGNLATMETDLSRGSAPAVADAASATIMQGANELLRVITKHLLDGSDSGRQTGARCSVSPAPECRLERDASVTLYRGASALRESNPHGCNTDVGGPWYRGGSGAFPMQQDPASRLLRVASARCELGDVGGNCFAPDRTDWLNLFQRARD
jgi:hypothetical protein